MKRSGMAVKCIHLFCNPFDAFESLADLAFGSFWLEKLLDRYFPVLGYAVQELLNGIPFAFLLSEEYALYVKGSSLLLTLERYYIHVFIAFLSFTFISFHVLTFSSWSCNTAFI
jgi:hypothetical protein